MNHTIFDSQFLDFPYPEQAFDPMSIDRSIRSIKEELKYLAEAHQISEDFHRKFLGEFERELSSRAQQTPATSGSFQAPPTYSTTTNTTANTGDYSLELAEAIYDFAPVQEKDMGLHKGDQIVVVRHLNNDWWYGECGSTRRGIFPANYVRVIPESDLIVPDYLQDTSSMYQPYVAPQDLQNSRPMPEKAQNSWGSPPQQQQQQYTQQPPYIQQQPPQQQPQQVIVQQAQPGSSQAPSKVHKLGSRFGEAALFGAGAAVGSSIVNSIF